MAQRKARLLVLLLLSLVAFAAHADKRKKPAPKPTVADAEAEAHYRRALTYYNLREYGIAVAEFKEAYAISNEPLLLFNIGQAYRLDKQYEEALHYYHTFLQLRPRAPNRRDVEQFIAELERAQKQDRGTHEEPNDNSPETPTQLPAWAPPSETTPQTTAAAPPPQLSPPPSTPQVLVASPPAKKPLRKQWWIWTVGSVAVVGAGLGLGLGLTLGRHEVLPSGTLGSIDARH